MSTFDELVETAETGPRFRVPVRLVLDAEAYNRSVAINTELETLIATAQLAVDEDDVTEVSPAEKARALAQEMADLHEQHPSTTFWFEQLDALSFSDLDAEHPGDRDARDPFWLHLLAACCVEPEGSTFETWERLRSSLSAGQFEQLRAGAEAVNLATFDLRPTSAASALLRGLRPNSTSPADTAPPAADSSDE